MVCFSRADLAKWTKEVDCESTMSFAHKIREKMVWIQFKVIFIFFIFQWNTFYPCLIMVLVGWDELSNYIKSKLYDIFYSWGWKKRSKKKKIQDSEIRRDRKLSIYMQSMDQIQFGEILNSNPFALGVPYKALRPYKVWQCQNMTFRSPCIPSPSFTDLSPHLLIDS